MYTVPTLWSMESDQHLALHQHPFLSMAIYQLDCFRISLQVGGRARAACAGPGSREHTRHESLGHVAAFARREAGQAYAV